MKLSLITFFENLNAFAQVIEHPNGCAPPHRNECHKQVSEEKTDHDTVRPVHKINLTAIVANVTQIPCNFVVAVRFHLAPI